MSTSVYTALFHKILKRKDLVWLETSPREIIRSKNNCRGKSHMFYCPWDGMMIKISLKTWVPSERIHKNEVPLSEGFEEIEFFLEDQKRRFGRRSCLDLRFNADCTDWDLLKSILKEIQEQKSTQYESALVVPPADMMLERIVELF